MRTAPLFAPLLLLAGCKVNLTLAEALEAVSEAALSAQGEAATYEVIEVSTHFTLGQAAEEAAEELAEWYVSQIPCSQVTVEGHTVTTDFGTLADGCTYNGHTYAGLASVTLERTEVDEVVVTHEWAGLTNGAVTLDGTATVTWDGSDLTRHVVHDVTWTFQQRSVHATGDRLQELVDEDQGIEAGIRIDGERDWEAESGEWHLDIDGVEMRGQDPVPQAGEYTLTLPDGRQLGLDFQRLDDDTIRVTFTGTWRQWVFDVSSAGTEVAEV